MRGNASARPMKFDMIRNNETKNLAKWKGKKEEKLPGVKTLLYRSNGGYTTVFTFFETESLRKCEGKWAYIFTLTLPIPCIHGLSMPPVWDQNRCDGCGCDGVGGGGSGGASDGNGIRQVEQKYCIRQKIHCLEIFDRTRMQILINYIRLRLIYNLFAHSAIMSSLPPPPSPSLLLSLENAEFAQTA